VFIGEDNSDEGDFLHKACVVVGCTFKIQQYQKADDLFEKLATFLLTSTLI
jgi:hypothetical protein